MPSCRGPDGVRGARKWYAATDPAPGRRSKLLPNLPARVRFNLLRLHTDARPRSEVACSAPQQDDTNACQHRVLDGVGSRVGRDGITGDDITFLGAFRVEGRAEDAKLTVRLV